MRRTLICLLTVLGIVVALVGVGTTPASAARSDKKPCGQRVLRATHAASASSYDDNADRLECWPRQGSRLEPGDNYRLDTPGYGSEMRKFYAWGGEETGISFLNRRTQVFGGYLAGQEDDPDFDGCQYICRERLHYDRNDYFYFATAGQGSVRRSLQYFEDHARGYARVTMVYSRLRAAHSVFSFESAPR